MEFKELENLLHNYYIKSTINEEQAASWLLIDLLEFLKDAKNEILDRIVNKYNLSDYFIKDFKTLKEYLNIKFINKCILFYFDFEELKSFTKKYTALTLEG